MYGGRRHSSKLRSGAPKVKRLLSSVPPPPLNRPSLGGSAGRHVPRGEAEETFSLVSGNNPVAFSMIIRLAPDMVEEIKRVEAQGGRTRVKFDSNPYNPSGNIIDVGGKQFRFTWSQEFGDLCDIYEECRCGEDGNGLLVESGCAWRKLNVQRILDESTKNHVKMLSEEAERKLRSRKAIVLEPGSPSMRSQIKALAAVEATSRKNYIKKKEAAPPKKRKVETLQVTATKGRHSSPLDQSAASSSPLGAVNISKGTDDAVPSQMIGQQDTNNVSEKEIPTRTNNAMRNTPGGKGNNIAKSIDLLSILISLLMHKPNGLTLKALEKAVQDIVPNQIKKIKPIVRKIARYKSPGRYILLPGVNLESFKKAQTENGSSPDDDHRQLPAHQELRDQTPAPQGGFKKKVPNDDVEKLVRLNSKAEEESNTLEKINVQHALPDIFGEKQGSELSEGQGGSSSDSGTDSDSGSDSSDSGKGSGGHGRSRSRRPAGTESGSSSDSGSDASSYSEEGFDEDVDIMTSDAEKESKYKTEAFDHRVSALISAKSPNGRSLLNEIHEKQDDNESDAIEIEKNWPEKQEAEFAQTTVTISNNGRKVAEDMPFSPDYKQLQECQNYIGSLFDKRENGVKGSSRHEQFDSCERLTKGKKRKRGSDVKNIDEKAECIKRSKSENVCQAQDSPGVGVQTLEGACSFSPLGFTEDTFEDLTVQVGNRGDRHGNSHVGLQKGYNQTFLGKSTSDLTQTGQRSFNQTLLGKSSNPLEKSDKQDESLGHSRRHSEKDFHACEGSSMQKDKSHRDAQNEDIHATDKKVSKNSRHGSNGGKQSLSLDSHCLEQVELVKKLKEGQQSIHSQMGTSPKDNNRISTDKFSIINGRGISIQRDLPDLELGEIRESTSDENHLTKQLERKKLFEHLENSANSPEERNPEQHDTKRGPVPSPVKESKRQTPNSLEEVADRGKYSGFADENNVVLKRREPYSDENSCPYIMYEKDEPELKGPIKTFSQYKEYVQEFRDKYDSYRSMRKILESYSNEFYEIGKNLKYAKEDRDVDMYYNTLRQLKESYQRGGMKHKRLKKIYVVLHLELEQLKQRIKDFVDSYNKK